MTAPSMDATTAVLLTNADRKAVENHTFTSTLLKEPVPTRLANQLMTRVFSTASDTSSSNTRVSRALLV